jgi:hypothetical protein
MKWLASFALIVALTFLLMSYSKSSPASVKGSSKVARIWRGWTSKENADKFEQTLTGEAIPSIRRNRPAGCLGLQLLRRDLGEEVEFTTIMQFASIEAVKAFAGNDYEAAHIDPSVKQLLVRYDERVSHYENLYQTNWQEN